MNTSFREFTDHLHSLGLKAGIYTDIGRNSCSQRFDPESPNLPEGTIKEREIGLFGFVNQDIQLFFNEWGFDYVKVDACGIADYGKKSPATKNSAYGIVDPLIVRGYPNLSDHSAVETRYASLSDSLVRSQQDGDFVLSICTWGEANVRAWGKDHGNLWRTSGDITPQWSRMLHTFDSAAKRALYAGPGTWNDPDMLFIGHGDFDDNHLREARSHFALWSIIAAPLLIGYDLRDAPQALLDIWGHEEIIAVNQDAGGHQGVIAYDSDDIQIIVKTLSGEGKKAVAIFNRGFTAVDAAVTWDHLKFKAGTMATIRDLWAREALTPQADIFSVKVESRQTLMYKFTGVPKGTDSVYLSEIPGRINVAVDGVSIIGYAGWGGPRADANPYGQRLQVAGHAYPYGIGSLSNSRFEIKNNSEYKRFSAEIGVDDHTPNVEDSVTFRIYGDAQLLYESASIKFGENATNVDVDITGVNIVEIVADAQSSTPSLTPIVAWANAKLYTAQ